MNKDYLKEKYRDLIISNYKEKGLDYVGEFSVLYSIPLELGYEVIMEYTQNQEDKDMCRFKIDYLSKFYKGN